MLLLWTFVSLLLFATCTHAIQNFHLLKRQLGTGSGSIPYRKRSLSNDTLTVELNIDHFGGFQGTFKNRYWINDTYYKGGPVFVYDAGEGDAEPFVAILQEKGGIQSSLMELTKKYNGLAILWEHRYYGQSIPFLDKLPSVVNFTVNEWQYLTLDQALEDVSVFAKGFTLPASSQIKLNSPDALKPANTPWVFIGASYPGVRAAVLRVRNPDVVYASWSSSGPVQSQINMASYFEAVERALARNCSADWVAVTKYVDGVLSGNDTTQQLAVRKALYVASMSGPGGNTSLVQPVSDAALMAISPGDIAEILLYPAFTFQSDGLPVLEAFCGRVETLNFTNSPPSQGLTLSRDVNTTFSAFVTAIAELNKSSLFADQGDISAAYSWSWQFCTEFGYFQVADPNNPVNMVSTFNSLAAQQAYCDQIFSNQEPHPPNVTALNKYGGWNMTPSNVFFSNGEFDPWRTLSVNSQESNAPQRNGSETVPACNASPQFPSFFGTTYPQQVHGSDVFMRPTYPQGEKDAFAKGFSLFTSALDQWLPCHHPVSSANNARNSGGKSLLSGWLFLLSISLGPFLPFVLN